MNYIYKSSRGLKEQGRFTRRSFLQYKQSIEDFIKNHPDKGIYNINDYGIAINGVQKLSYNDFFNNFATVDIDKPGILNKIYSEINYCGVRSLFKSIASFFKNDSLVDELIDASSVINLHKHRKTGYRNLFLNLKSAKF